MQSNPSKTKNYHPRFLQPEMTVNSKRLASISQNRNVSSDVRNDVNNTICDLLVALTTEYYTEGSLDEKSVTRIGSCQGGECLDSLAMNFIPASA